MFSLISGLWDYLFSIPQYNVIVLGLDNAGKSTFLHQIKAMYRDRNKKSKQSESPRPILSHMKDIAHSNKENNANWKRKTSNTQSQYEKENARHKNGNDKNKKARNQINKETPNESKCKDNDDEKQESSNRNENETIKSASFSSLSEFYYEKDARLRNIVPTIGLNIAKIEFATMKLQFWDLGGQTQLRTIWPNYFKETHCIVFMVDSADVSRFNEVRKEISKLLTHEHLKYCPFLVLGNKQDLNNAVHYQQLHKLLIRDDIKDDILKDRSFKLRCSCCLSKQGIDDAMSWICYSIPLAKKRLDHMAKLQMTPGTSQSNPTQTGHVSSY